MKNDFNKLLGLLDENKDNKSFIMDNLGKIRYVLMSFEEYENLKNNNLTDDQVLSKINREIALWKAENKEEEAEIQELIENEEEEEEEKFYFEQVEE